MFKLLLLATLLASFNFANGHVLPLIVDEPKQPVKAEVLDPFVAETRRMDKGNLIK